MPKFLYTYDVNPEQSNPVDGDVPPYLYFTPINCFAYATTLLPVVDVAVPDEVSELDGVVPQFDVVPLLDVVVLDDVVLCDTVVLFDVAVLFVVLAVLDSPKILVVSCFLVESNDDKI